MYEIAITPYVLVAALLLAYAAGMTLGYLIAKWKYQNCHNRWHDTHDQQG
jgi:hypothetical protein